MKRPTKASKKLTAMQKLARLEQREDDKKQGLRPIYDTTPLRVLEDRATEMFVLRPHWHSVGLGRDNAKKLIAAMRRAMAKWPRKRAKGGRR